MSGSLTVGGAATFSSNVTAGGTITTNGDKLNIRGGDTFMWFTENSVADKFLIGSSAGSNDLVFRSGAYNLSQGTERMRLTSSGSLGLGVTPSAWNSIFNVIQGPQGSVVAFQNNGPSLKIGSNFYYSTLGQYEYITTNPATRYEMDTTHRWSVAPSGTAGAAITFTQAMTLDSSGRLMVGNTSVSALNEKFNITGNGIAIEATDAGSTMILGNFGGADGVVGMFTNDNLQIRTNNVARLTIASTGAATFSSSVTATSATLSGSTSDRLIMNRTSVGSYHLTISSTNRFSIYDPSADAERLSITSTGNVGIGTTSPSSTINPSAGVVLALKNTSTFPSIVLQSTNSQEAGITLANSLFIDCDGNSTASNNNIIFRTGNTNGTFSATERMRITAAGVLELTSGQLKFPSSQNASADANTLDDYEEGTFTATVVGGTTAGTGTYSRQVGVYTKIGNLVTCNVWIQWSAHTGTGDLYFGGFPFTSTGTTNYRASGVIAYFENLTLTAGFIPGLVIVPSTTQASVTQNPVGGGAIGAAAQIDTAANIHFAITYQTT